jgi:hypothetical protein
MYWKNIYDKAKDILGEEPWMKHCQCGTIMNFFTQNGTNRPITGDPGSSNVRKARYSIRMWRGLYGDNAPAVSDHVENFGSRCKSLMAAGYVMESKFWSATAAQPSAAIRKYFPMAVEEGLAKGTYLDLYKFGFDYPEVLAYDRADKHTIYFSAFASNAPVASFTGGSAYVGGGETTMRYDGPVELRGLIPGATYTISNYDYDDTNFAPVTLIANSKGIITVNVGFVEVLPLKAELHIVGASIRSNESDVVINNPASYTVSLKDTKGAASFELSFTFNDDFLDKDSITMTPLNGFDQGVFPPPVFKYLGQGNWEVTVKYMYILADKFVDVYGPLDVLKISGTAVANGPATVKLTDFTVWGDINTGLGLMLSFIDKSEATTNIGSKPPKYSKYDLNKDGKIDETDLLYLVYFYQWTDRDPGWATEDLYGIFAKDCDFQINGRIDLADMIELIANYGSYDPYGW